MVGIVTPNASAGESVSYGEIAAIEHVLKASFGTSGTVSMSKLTPANSETYLDLSSKITDVDRTAKPCLDQDHHVSLIDVAGPSAAAIVDFTDCSGATFSDMYVLEKRNDQWTISEKVWDSHAHSWPVIRKSPSPTLPKGTSNDPNDT